MEQSGLEAVFLANREALVRFLRAQGAGDAVEDLLQELWLKLRGANTGPVAAPLPYLYRAANNLMLDRYRAARQATQRDTDWSEMAADAAPGVDRAVIARQQVAMVEQALDSVGERAAAIFRRHRIDGIAQRRIAADMGISLSTVESDLRKAYAALVALRRSFDEA
ncbi:RNA polymerase sigma factor [uncultured Sphingomonas sp.]|uniref:RNA polymerase sigma factor n=1 Tax=uncultured Sphingomonas sp. TaxID=158754 RepID=UPI0025DFDFF7|nr:RNA polymerase sigma factor [uncultured Sphingomonas sp.]